jgi:hypothetical protein
MDITDGLNTVGHSQIQIGAFAVDLGIQEIEVRERDRVPHGEEPARVSFYDLKAVLLNVLRCRFICCCPKEHTVYQSPHFLVEPVIALVGAGAAEIAAILLATLLGDE